MAKSNDEPLAGDKLDKIEEWLNYMKTELLMERLSYGEIVEIEDIWQLVIQVER